MKYLLIALLFIGCREEAQETAITTNPNVEVQLLFEKDGCKIYRFYDGRWIYYTDCRGKVDATYKTTTHNGKTTNTTTHYLENETVR